MSIVVVGSINADLVMRAERAPLGGETLLGHEFSIGVGGKGLNQCAAIALQRDANDKVYMVGCIGRDAHGEMCQAAMIDLGIDTKHVRTIKDKSTGVAMIVVEDSGDNRILLSPGSNACLNTDDLESLSSILSKSSVAVFQLESPLEVVHQAIQMAEKAGLHTILNPAPATDLSNDLLSNVSYLIPNETEAAILSGIEVRDADTAITAGEALLARGVKKAVIVTLGPVGCVLVTHHNSLHIPTRQVKAVDTTAAGDSFIGGFAVKIAHGAGLRDAVNFGQIVAAITVTRHGALKSIPRKEELDDLEVEGSTD